MGSPTVTLIVLATLALVALEASAGDAEDVGVPSCPPKHDAHVVLADPSAVVFKGPRIDEGTVEPEKPEFYGCVRPHGRSYLLGIPPSYGSPSGSAGTGKYRLSGVFVAFEEFSSTNLNTYYRYDEYVVVRDLRNGRTLHRLPTGTGNSLKEREEGDVGIGSVTALVVKNDGAVAWIVETSVPKGVREFQVHAVDSTGSRVLAEGPLIEPEFLKLRGSTLTWEVFGKRYDATLH